ncbi:MAG: sulfatase-like hydrolase/transferase [Candidatus Hydrogenedentes bacterium]|nr:sulfatase-like hydrolase/transferase [Candidatus Hydrogenedentota bacterium]
MNVLFIIADQYRWDCVGAAGNPIIRTPNLDALAQTGVLFTNCFVQACPCGPSRMCIYTSRYQCSTRTVDNMTPLMDAEENVAKVLRDVGYAPAIIGYNDYAVDPRMLPVGDRRTTGLSYANFLPGLDARLYHEYDSPEYFDWLRRKGYPEWLLTHDTIHKPDIPAEGPGEHLPLRYPAYYRAEDSESQFVTSVAIDYLTKRRGKSWVLSLNYIKPHPPRIAPAPYNDMYDPAAMPAPNRCPEELETDHPYLRHMRREPALVSERDLRETQANYYAMITELDTCLGRLFTALHETAQWDDTLIIFTSDHGEYLGDHFFSDKAHFYDETMRVPLIIREPTRAADAMRGRSLDYLCESIDFAPTMLDFLGVPIPDRFQGQSLLGLVRDTPDAAPKKRIHFEFDFRNRMRDVPAAAPDSCVLWVVRDTSYKYVQFGLENMPPLLFDLKHDPEERKDLADQPEYAAVVADYCQTLLRWRMKHEDQRMEHWASQFR